MYNFQFTFIYPISHKLNAMTYGFIFLFQNYFEYIFLYPYQDFFHFLIGFWADYFFVYFTLPTPKNNYKKHYNFFSQLCFKKKIKIPTLQLLFFSCWWCSSHISVNALLVLVPLLITCWCFYFSHVGGATHCAFVLLPFLHWCCCSFHVSVVVFLTYMCYCPYHVMLVFLLHWPCCSSHVILLLLSFGVVILLTLVLSFFQHGVVVLFALVLRYLLAQPLLLLSSHRCPGTYWPNLYYCSSHIGVIVIFALLSLLFP
jgi:hypothetical protein